LADGNLVDADGPRRRLTGTAELLGHVLLVDFLDRLPIEEQILGNRFDGAVPAAPAHKESKALRVEGIVGQPIEAFGLHGLAPWAPDPANEEVEIDAPVATGKIADTARPLIVKGCRYLATRAADRFFPRRWSVRTTAQRSPKSPWTLAKGTNPGKRYWSRSCPFVGIGSS
jgi:hypothetical protein